MAPTICQPRLKNQVASVPALTIPLLFIVVLLSCTQPHHVNSTMCGTASAPSSVPHRNHEQLLTALKALNTQYPSLTRLFNIGKSQQGREIPVLKISTSPDEIVSGKPMFKYLANMHGNEAAGREILVAFAEELLKLYTSGDVDVVNTINSMQLYFLPTLNPDGREISTEGDCSSVNGRRTSNNVDLNRDFPDQYVPGKQPEASETNLIMAFLKKNNFVLSANFHGGALVVNYPYDGNTAGISVYSASPDDTFFREISTVYASENTALVTANDGTTTGSASSCSAFTNGITNGADWFHVYGGMQDWNYVYTNCFEVLVEMSCCKFPPQASMVSVYNQNCQSMYNYMKKVHSGVKGFVVDENERPIVGAVVTVVGIEGNTVTTGMFGDYYRLLQAGQFTIKVSATGKETLTTTITVSNTNTTSALRLDFKLLPSGSTYSGTSYVYANDTYAAHDFNLDNLDSSSAALGTFTSSRLYLTKLSIVHMALYALTLL
eukprot:Nk52_evm8s168 gene=Nk52_evmTU8s168